MILGMNLFIKIVFLFNVSIAVASYPIHREPIIVIVAVILFILFRFLIRKQSNQS